MEPNTRDERRKIFRQELYTLKDEGYLSENIVEKVAKAHHQYHLELVEIEAITLPTKKQGPIIKAKSVKPHRVKKTPTPEAVRERNITWLLNMGVIFLLIGGLFVATSNWESMSNTMKSGSIAIVVLLFYGIAFLAKKILNIEKTAFAFIVLGSLFLPIFILSLGWFGLIGHYLSIDGEGRYLLGMLGSFLPIIVYVHFAKNLASRLFVWFTYVSVSAGVAFLLAGLQVKVDYFYLGMMFFNAILILVYHLLKHVESFQLFTKEYIPYIQVNLILSTLFMLFLYDNLVLYSFNLLLTAVIYLSMMYVKDRKEYPFIFTVMLVYGAYQLIEHSFLAYFGAIVYALIGFGLAFVPRAMDKRFLLDKVFQYTSAGISGFAFIYITLDGLLLRAGNPSIVLMLAYFIIATNFIYLSHQGSKRLFPYLGSVFVAAGIYEACTLLVKSSTINQFALPLFTTGLLLFIVFGISHLSKHLKIIQTSSKDVGIAVMTLAIMSTIAFSLWWELGVMLLFLVVVAYLLYKMEKRILLKELAIFVLPGSLGLSIVAFGEELNSNFLRYHDEFGYACNFAVGALLVLLSSIIWKKRDEKELNKISLYTSLALYSLAIFHAWLSPINHLWVQPLVLVIGIGVYYYIYKMIATKWVPFLVSTATLLSYFSIIAAIMQKFPFNSLFNSFIASTSAVTLLSIAFLSREKNQTIAHAFAWLGHCVYPVALLYTWFAFHTDSTYSFILALLVYATSTKVAMIEWKIKVFLYGFFTSLFFVVSTGMDYLFVPSNGGYVFPITSGLILLFLLISSEEIKKRTVYYFVPFSIIGIVFMLLTYPFGWLPYLVVCVYISGTLIYLHKINCGLIGILPLLFAFIATVEISYFASLTELEKLLLAGGVGIFMIIIGQIVYKKLFENGTKFQEIKLDGYTVVAFLYFWLMYFYESPYIWNQALPGVLIAASFWLQRKRVPASFSVVLKILGGSYLLQPYYSIIAGLNIPALWEREVRVLPFILLIIFIRHSLKGRYSDITKAIQWGVLIMISLLLIQDGLASNTIYDAIILGSLSLLSMLSGMVLQIKSYFFVGTGVLLLNVFLQTRPYWGNMPWWVYLLITGLILITVASFNEWNKQKMVKGEATFITKLKGKVMNNIKQWD